MTDAFRSQALNACSEMSIEVRPLMEFVT